MQPEDRIITGQEQEADVWQYSLRPRRLGEYIGQNQVKQNMEVFIKAAADRNEALDHVLLFGPPGLGKTTLANIIANELNVNIRVTSGPAIERQGDLAAILTNLGDNDVLFIDEIHRLSKTVEEILYSAMEDYALDIIIGKGPSARSVRLDLPKFTLIGATTVWALLRRRCAIVLACSAGWSFISRTSCSLSLPARPRYWAWRSCLTVRRKLPAAAGARPVWLTVC